MFSSGLFLQGACWDSDAGVLAEARPRELFSPMPYMLLLPARTTEIDTTRHLYGCPVYKTSERAGVLSTSGHSSNFVMVASLPMAAHHTSQHWIKRGLALFTMLDT